MRCYKVDRKQLFLDERERVRENVICSFKINMLDLVYLTSSIESTIVGLWTFISEGREKWVEVKGRNCTTGNKCLFSRSQDLWIEGEL